jgi:beta-glucuronidase
MLYPISTETRRITSLDGIWRFRFDPAQGRESAGITRRFAEAPLTETISMPVPSAWNDMFEDQADREFVGWVWYERTFATPSPRPGESTVLRFGSATHEAIVWVNGTRVAEHSGGFTPFEAVLDDVLVSGENRITVAVSNVLDYGTLPIGNYEEREVPGLGTRFSNRPNFDFYNYAGLQRSVVLCSVPSARITDIVITADYEGTEGIASYAVTTTDAASTATVTVEVIDEDGVVRGGADGATGEIRIPDVRRWNPLDAYLYTLRVTLMTDGEISDVYNEPFGVRRVEVRDGRFFINERPFYFKGFGKHEDAPLRGRGVDEVTNLKDLRLIRWMGGNSLRTSHYLYSEEFMRLCDREGIVVIDEVPAVGLMIGFDFDIGNMMGGGKEKPDTWKTLTCGPAHRRVVEEMIARDKNHPSVVMWSVGNEPDSGRPGAGEYFAPIFDRARALDPSHRPVTCVLLQHGDITRDEVAPLADVVCINRYYGWYFSSVDLEIAQAGLAAELTTLGELFPDRPVLFTEYGADTVAGLHDTGSVMFTEEYQVQYYEANHAVFDRFPQVVGEQPWNFADFATAQSVLRVQGNKKGLFTRERQPKQAVFALKKRWEEIPHFDYKGKENEK